MAKSTVFQLIDLNRKVSLLIGRNNIKLERKDGTFINRSNILNICFGFPVTVVQTRTKSQFFTVFPFIAMENCPFGLQIFERTFEQR